MTHPRIRPRLVSDLPPLTAILAGQQSESRYPMRWPLPFPTADFLVRATELAAWVIEVDEVVAGHVSVCGVPEGIVADGYRSALRGVEIDSLGLISVLLVDSRLRGRGLGRALLETAVDWIRANHREPALDVLPVHEPAMALYRSAGWVEVGRVRPEWLPDAEPDMVLMVLRPA